MSDLAVHAERPLATSSDVTPAPAGLIQRACSCGQHTIAGDECEACRNERLGLQPKLTVSQPGDEHEDEADRIAGAVMRMRAAPRVDASVLREPADIDRQADGERDEEDDEEEQLVHPMAAPGPRSDGAPGSTPRTAPAAMRARLDALGQGGQPLPASERTFFEARLGRDLGQVRVHADDEAGSLARALHAEAFAREQHVFFAPGRYQPHTEAGRQLLAHELVHTLQQERDADRVHRRAVVDAAPVAYGPDPAMPAGPTPAAPAPGEPMPPAATSSAIAAPAEAEPDASAPTEPAPAVGPAPSGSDASAGAPPAGAAPGSAPGPGPSAGGAAATTAAGAAPPEGDGRTMVPTQVTLETSTEEALLQSLASVPVSMFARATSDAERASGELQTRERGELAASLPEIERPTGLPRLPERPGRSSSEVPAGQVPEPETPPAQASPATEPPGPEPTAPLPAAQVETRVEEPADDEEGGGWWSWLTGAVTRFFRRLPTSDPTLDTSAGARPRVDRTRDADPAQNERQRRRSDAEVDARAADADQATRGDFGENGVYPDAPEGTLRPNYRPTGGPGAAAAAAREPTGVPPVVRSGVDRAGRGWLADQVGERVEQERQDRAQYESDSERERADTQHGLDVETARVRGEQEDERTAVRREVTDRRAQWRTENRRIQERYGHDAATQSADTTKQIDDQVRGTERRADDELTNAESQAEEHRRDTERKAAEKKREAENRPRGFWARLRGAVSDFFDELKSRVNALFDAARRFVRGLIDRAKRVVRTWIEAARRAIVGLIRAFGEVLKGFVTVALAAFPEAAERARRFIDDRVDDAIQTVNDAAAALQDFAQRALDALGAALDAILAVFQRAFSLLIGALKFLAVGLVEILERIGHLVEAGMQMPSHFLGQVSEELIGQDLTKPLPFELTEPRAPAAQVAAALASGELAPEDARAVTRTSVGDGDVAVDHVAQMDLDPGFIAALDMREGETREFGENSDPSRTIAALQREQVEGPASAAPGVGSGEATGAEPEGGAQGTEPPEAVPGAAPEEPPGSVTTDGHEPEPSAAPAELTAEQRLENMLKAEPEPPCPKEASTERAGQDTFPESQKFGPLTVGQRASYLTRQLIKGVRNWFACNWPKLLAAAIGVLTVLIVLEILTGGAITAALPPLMELIGMLMLGVAAVRVALWVGEYLSKGWAGDITRAARALARGLAVGAIELIFTLLFDFNAVIKAVKQGLTATLRGAATTARAAGRTLLRSATRIGRAGVRTARAPLRAAALVGRAVVRRGRLILQGLRRGFARGVRSLEELGRRLANLVRFRRFSLSLSHRVLTLWGHFNPKVPLARVLLPEIEHALAGQARAQDLRAILQRERRLGSSAVAAAHGAGAAWSVSKFGRQADELFELAKVRPDLRGLLSGRAATEEVLVETLQMAERLNVSPAQLGAVVDDMQLLRAISSHAERQLVVAAGESSRAFGVSRALCGDCPHFFSGLARYRVPPRGIVLADPAAVWVFLTNGRVIRLTRSEIEPLIGLPDAVQRLAGLLERAR
jgi:hypothetical protein